MANDEPNQERDEEHRALDDLLRERLPRHEAPPALHASLEAKYANASARNESSARPPPRRLAYVAALAAAFALAVALVFVIVVKPSGAESSPLVAEALNDHLRILYAEHPVEIASGGIHQVKPWFEGKVDFAPVEPFAGDADFPLEGGSVAYYIDRKAAAFVFKRRLHVISLFVFRADGLSFPAGAETTPRDTRGFHVLVWRTADLGYALVSDVDPAELLTLAAKIRAGSSSREGN